MTYTVAAIIGVVAALTIDLVLLRTRLVTRQVFWLTYPIVLVGQLVSNGFLTGLHVVRYSPRAIEGFRIAYAPVEDLGFGFALVLTTLSLWVWLGRRGLDRGPRAGERRRRGARGGSGERAGDARADNRSRAELQPADRAHRRVALRSTARSLLDRLGWSASVRPGRARCSATLNVTPRGR